MTRLAYRTPGILHPYCALGSVRKPFTARLGYQPQGASPGFQVDRLPLTAASAVRLVVFGQSLARIGFVALFLLGGPTTAAISQQTLEGGAKVGSHLEHNPVYRDLVQAEPEAPIRLEPAALADRQSAEQQQVVIEQLIADKYDLERFLRPSVFAPHVLRIERDELSESLIAMRVAVFFAGQGNLQAISNSKFLNALVQGDDGANARELSESELAAADVSVDSSEPRREHYHLVRGNLFDRVQFRGVSRSYWTCSDDSILLALKFDSRFETIDGLQPTWVRFERAADGSLEPVEEGVFRGGGLYIKITQLQAPDDRLLVEARMVLLEPHAWFGGANLLGSKLPPAIQSEVREIRRKALRATKNAE